MGTFLPTIGLEIHAELNTRTKMFCASKNEANETRPNTNVCPVCMAHPGALPVINREAVRHVLRVGTALGGTLADYSEFDRKNYFYPDLPKGYQLSQYEYPLVSGGSLNGINITRIHLEEDTASSVHDDVSGTTLIDYNRAGVPLMELVTDPVIHSALDAGNFGRELQLLLRTLHASDADMEKGQMRLEANISISRSDLGNLDSKVGPLGTKVEVKNINSFRAMERAVEYEIKRQQKLLESGKKVVQETRGWDDTKQATFSQRIKEGSADYRYFPDPDLPSLLLSEFPDLHKDVLRKGLPELPQERRERYKALGLSTQDADLYVKDELLGRFFEEIASQFADADRVKLASNYIANDLVNIMRDAGGRDSEIQREIKISANNFKKLIDLIADKKISSRSGKELLAACAKSDLDPEELAKERALYQDKTSDQLDAAIKALIDQNPAVVADFKAGKLAALEYLVGQGMKALRGAANPVQLREAIKNALS